MICFMFYFCSDLRTMFQRRVPRQSRVPWTRGQRPPPCKRSRKQGPRRQSRQEAQQEARRLSHRRWRINRSTVRSSIDPDYFKHRVDNFKAGSISRCFSSWRKITSDTWILNLVNGYRFKFRSEPFQYYRPKPLRLNVQSQKLLDDTLYEFLKVGIIEPCNVNDFGFYSTLFPIAKKDNSARIIFNLSELNFFIKTDHFKMDTVKHAIELITPNAFFASVDF